MAQTLYPMYCDECGKVGLYSTLLLFDGQDMEANLFVLIDGERPFDGQPIECGVCRSELGFHYESDVPIEVEFPS